MSSDETLDGAPELALDEAPGSESDGTSESASTRKSNVSDEVVIRFDHVTKTYKLYKNDRNRVRSILGFKQKKQLIDQVDANNDLSFEIKKGEAVAFLGHNGAGKSTALKMITGVAHPTQGKVTVHGRVSALLELSAGFDNKLTGRENIELRGRILGMKGSAIKSIEPKVVEFADLGLYIDQPLKTYSSGMKARLGFAIAVAVDPEILVVDEALSVGDRAFRRKCLDRIAAHAADAEYRNVRAFQLFDSPAANEHRRADIFFSDLHNALPCFFTV